MEAKRRRSTELKAKKNKIQIPSKTVAQMLQQKKITKPNASDNSDEIEEIEINDSDSAEAVVSTSVRDVIDSVAKGEEQLNEKNGEEKNTSNCSSDGDEMMKKDNAVAVKLPDKLPNELTALIEKIKKVLIFCFEIKSNDCLNLSNSWRRHHTTENAISSTKKSINSS